MTDDVSALIAETGHQDGHAPVVEALTRLLATADDR